jgi:hypothetical protein
MKIRRALTGAAAAALLVVGAGAGDAAALTVTPYTGAAPCTSTNLHQYTRYHGTICYSNVGDDDLSSSGFWTIQISTGCYFGYLNYYDTNGKYYHNREFGPGAILQYPTFPTDVVSLVYLHVESTTC